MKNVRRHVCLLRGKSYSRIYNRYITEKEPIFLENYGRESETGLETSGIS